MWTKEQEELLIVTRPHSTRAELAGLLGKSKNSISVKVRQLGLGAKDMRLAGPNLTGAVFGHIVVESFDEETMMWKCRCVCGKTMSYKHYNLLKRKTNSCGCMSGKISSDKSYKGIEATWRSLWNSYKTGARHRAFTFNIEFEEFKRLCSLECYYCGRVGVNKRFRKSKYKQHMLEYNGLDRFDNSVGYEPTNVVTCCQTCNYAKQQMSFNEFEDWLRVIFRNNIEKRRFDI